MGGVESAAYYGYRGDVPSLHKVQTSERTYNDAGEFVKETRFSWRVSYQYTKAAIAGSGIRKTYTKWPDFINIGVYGDPPPEGPFPYSKEYETKTGKAIYILLNLPKKKKRSWYDGETYGLYWFEGTVRKPRVRKPKEKKK